MLNILFKYYDPLSIRFMDLYVWKIDYFPICCDKCISQILEFLVQECLKLSIKMRRFIIESSYILADFIFREDLDGDIPFSKLSDVFDRIEKFLFISFSLPHFLFYIKGDPLFKLEESLGEIYHNLEKYREFYYSLNLSTKKLYLRYCRKQRKSLYHEVSY